MKKGLYYIILMTILISVKNTYAKPPAVVIEPGNGVGGCATVNSNGTITYGSAVYANETAFFNAFTNGNLYPFEASYANNSFVPTDEGDDNEGESGETNNTNQEQGTQGGNENQNSGDQNNENLGDNEQTVENNIQGEPETPTVLKEEQPDGSIKITNTNGNVYYRGKRIYTVDDAAAVSGKTNTIKIRYK